MRDTEQTYRGWTLDVYEHDGRWVCDYWFPGRVESGGTVVDQLRKRVIELAKTECELASPDSSATS